MFTRDDLRTLLNAQPFVPFRLWLSDGGHIDVPSREIVLPGKRYAVVALLDPNTADNAFDRHTTVWYMHVTRHEALAPGAPPFTPPSGPAESTTPSRT